MFNSTAVCRTVSRLLAGTDGNPAYGGDKHGGRSYPSSDYRGAFYRAVCGTALKNRLINAVGALVMSLVLGLTTAYIISRKRFRFGMKKPLTYWVLDPVDGTTNLIHDYRASVISLAFMQKGSMVLGMIYNPYTDG